MPIPAPASRPRSRPAALAAGVVALLEVVGAVALALAAALDWGEALDTFLVTNALMGLAFTAGGLLVAWHRPANPIGWLLIGGGLGHATTALAAPLGRVLVDADAPTGLLRTVSTLAMVSWPWSIGLFLPLALLLFPDGRLPGPGWRPVAYAVGLTAPLFVLEMATEDASPVEGLPPGWLALPSYDSWGWLWTLAELRTVGAIVVALVALVVRYRRGDETRRRQLLWLLLAVVVVVAAVAPWSFVAGTPVLVLLALPLVPVAITVAVVRHQLLDIRLVLSRALSWLVLSVAVLAAYTSVVALLDTVVSEAVGRSALVTVLVCVVLAPLLPRLQREVDRRMYGERRNPATIAARMGEHLVRGQGHDLQGVAGALRTALRVPHTSISTGGVVLASDGVAPDVCAQVPLEYAGRPIGTVVIGLRPGERELSAVDAGTLGLVGAPLAVALHALALSQDLQASRERIVAAREEERRRLRRDLHDGLGPVLTGVALTADAVANLRDLDPERSAELVQALRRDTRAAITDVRRLVDNLRPPALDEVGLLGALRQRADQLRWRADGTPLEVRLVAPAVLPELPAAVEVAAYRIATEALTNVIRHSDARCATLTLRCEADPPALAVEVSDDGGSAATWSPGVGLEAMRERAAEVGARLTAGPSRQGGLVSVSIPLAASP